MSNRTIRALSAARLAACALAALALVSPQLHAHGSHTHGHGSVRLSIDGGNVEASFDVPLESFLGYDYPPRNPAQADKLAALRERLADPAGLIEAPAEARCSVVDNRVTPDLASAPADADISNLIVVVRLRCEQPEALKAFTFSAFRDHPGLKQLRVQLQDGSKRKTVTVRPRFPAITL